MIRQITAKDTYEIRGEILRPGQPEARRQFPDDDAPETLHLGYFTEGLKLVGVATVLHDPPPNTNNPNAWRLRGMATLPEVRGKGYGEQLLLAAIGHVACKGGNIFWCNARTPAIAFYQRHGFLPDGEEFLIDESGPHYYMARRMISESDKTHARTIIYFSTACG